MDEMMWFVGLFEGEGSFGFSKGRPRRMSISMTDLDTLEKVKSIVGGNIYSLTKRKPHWKDAWLWSIGGKDALELAIKIQPYLMKRRSQRCTEFINGFVTKESLMEIPKTKKELATELRDKGLTHKQISEQMGVERSYVSHLLGKRYMAY